jgi:hypothetical protein
MKTYLLEFHHFLETCYPDKTFDELEIELSDPTDDNISISRNSYCANPTPPHTSNILVASTRKKDKMQAFQNTLVSRHPDSVKKASSSTKPPTGYITAAEIYNGYTASMNLSQFTTKIDESTNTVLGTRVSRLLCARKVQPEMISEELDGGYHGRWRQGGS